MKQQSKYDVRAGQVFFLPPKAAMNMIMALYLRKTRVKTTKLLAVSPRGLEVTPLIRVEVTSRAPTKRKKKKNR